MVLIPDFAIGLYNGWLPFVAYVIIFGIIMVSFPKPVRTRLYDRSLWTKEQRLLTVIGKIIALINIILFGLSPIRLDSPVFYIGAGLWVVGMVGLVTALVVYRRTPFDKPVTGGIYKISRNPQVFSIWVVFVGICFMIGSVLSLVIMAVSLIFLHRSVLAEEKSCLTQYGDSYREFMQKVPRYFLFF